jgi:hypothetical protein
MELAATISEEVLLFVGMEDAAQPPCPSMVKLLWSRCRYVTPMMIFKAFVGAAKYSTSDRCAGTIGASPCPGRDAAQPCR